MKKIIASRKSSQTILTKEHAVKLIDVLAKKGVKNCFLDWDDTLINTMTFTSFCTFRSIEEQVRKDEEFAKSFKYKAFFQELLRLGEMKNIRIYIISRQIKARIQGVLNRVYRANERMARWMETNIIGRDEILKSLDNGELNKVAYIQKLFSRQLSCLIEDCEHENFFEEESNVLKLFFKKQLNGLAENIESIFDWLEKNRRPRSQSYSGQDRLPSEIGRARSPSCPDLSLSLNSLFLRRQKKSMG